MKEQVYGGVEKIPATQSEVVKIHYGEGLRTLLIN